MIETFRRSYHIFRESLTVLSKDKELLLFPFLSGIFSILAFATMVLAGWTTGFFERIVNAGERSLEANLLGYAALFAWYFVSWFIVLYFNVAVVHCARMRLSGGDPTLADGFRASNAHLGRIAAWAAISATVGLILKIIAERSQLVGKIITSLIGAAWSIATFFIVPVMIFEGRTIRESVRASTGLIRKTWGEGLVGAGGIGVFIMLLVLPSLIFPIAGFLISPMMAVVGLGVMVLYWLLLSIMSTALTAIYRTSLYLYATEGRTPAGFTPEYVEGAFAAKGGQTVLAKMRG
jgi:Family of unknown function (DUF6159)